jgi:hypothetical protein
MAQHAVANGYVKKLNLRPQLIAGAARSTAGSA